MAEDNVKKKAGLYVRVSSKRQEEEGYSIPVQKRRGLAYIEFKGWELYDMYKDSFTAKGISGRKDFKRMLEDARKKKFDVFLVIKIDRAFRNTLDALTIIDELEKLGIDFTSVDEQIDTTSIYGRAIFTVISTFAELERNKNKERVEDILYDTFKEGLSKSKPPLGYKVDETGNRVIDRETSEIVKEIFELALKDDYRKICNKIKIPHKDKKTRKIVYKDLKPQSFYNIIRNKFYIGIIEYRGEENKGKHEPIFKSEKEKELFNKVQEKYRR